jgi:pimeloyl-ACP methyl ester carboxylesterase
MEHSVHPFRSAQAQAEYHALYAERAKAWPVLSETRLVETPFPLVVSNVLDDETLQHLQVPALFLVDEHEKIYSASKAVGRLNRVAPQIKTAIIPQAGHDLWMVQADLVTRTMLDFLG